MKKKLQKDTIAARARDWIQTSKTWAIVPPLYLSTNYVIQEARRKSNHMNIPEREIQPEIT